MRRFAFALLGLAALLPAAPAWSGAPPRGTPIRLPAGLSLTPDGSTLVLSWRGDLWRCASTGGAARRLTFHPAPDTRPCVSPDGTQVAFTSTRTGSEQVFVLPLEGGTPRQVTQHSEGSRVVGWFPDGRSVLVWSRRDADWHAAGRLYRRPLDPDEPARMVFDARCGRGTVSPDGHWLAFTRGGMGWMRKGYHGALASQLWLYNLRTGAFRRLGRGDRGALWPLWAPDSRTLYYVAEDDGTWNLWSRDVQGGPPTQITHLKDDGVAAPTLSADGHVLVYRRLFDVFRLDLPAGGAPVPVRVVDPGPPTVQLATHVTRTRATQVAFTRDAREIAFVAGGDVWVMDTVLREPRRITRTAAEERDPVFAPDGHSLFFVSDALGSTDVWRARRTDEDAWWWQNETFDVTRVTHDAPADGNLRVTPDGKRLAWLKGSDLWSMALDGSDARRHVRSFEPVQWSFSPDGRWLAYAKPDDDFNWDVWIARSDGTGTPYNVSRHPDNDVEPAWSRDGKLLAFTGRRWDDESDIAYVWLRARDDEQGPRDRRLAKALATMKKRGHAGASGTGAAGKGAGKRAAPAGQPVGAPQPAGPAGTWNGQLAGPPPLPPDGLPLRVVVARKDGAWSVRVEVVGQFTTEAGALRWDAARQAFDFSLQTPLGPLGVSGRLEGTRMRGAWHVEGLMKGTFEATREAPAAAPAKAPASAATPGRTPAPAAVHIDFQGLCDRVERIPIPGARETDLLWSPSGETLAFHGSVDGTAGLYRVTFPDKLEPKRWSTLRGSGARWLRDGNRLAWLVGGVPATLTSSGKATSFPFHVRQIVDRPALHAAVFDEAWRLMRDHWYDDRLGNRDWDAVHAKYRPMAAACATTDQIALVVNMMLGELNGSHLGFWPHGHDWKPSGWTDVTGHLGCRFERDWRGPGLKVRDVVSGTPAHAARSRIRPGELVLAIDDRPVGPATNLTRRLTGDPGRVISVRVRAADGKERTLHMQPTTCAVVRRHLYDDWVRRTRAAVEKLSAGALGYVHVRSMDWSSFQRFEAGLFKAGHGHDGLLIDVRDNGGGFTTDHLLTCLTQPRHAITVPRGGGRGYPQDRMVYAPWHKPVVVLCNENSFSNAEIFAHAIRTLHRGAVVGAPTAGCVISTGAADVMGFGTLRIPFRGWFLLNGEDMELDGCRPDHVVWPRPEDRAAGRDRQVEKAVEVGLAEVKAWRGRPKVHLRKASER
jgi:Tol biopolymer transport system component/C-terminal processing protease CtpA/Prc